MTESNVRKDFVMPVAVLTIICLVMASLLAFTNGVTAPIIEKAEKQAAQQARLEVLPQAANFERVDIDPEKLPSSVTDVYKATNDTGYAVSVDGDGYGGKKTLKMIVGVDENGFITDTKVMSHSETPGLGSKVTEPDFKDQFNGLDESGLDGIVTISGATISSNHYIDTVRDALAAVEIAKEAE